MKPKIYHKLNAPLNILKIDVLVQKIIVQAVTIQRGKSIIKYHELVCKMDDEIKQNLIKYEAIKQKVFVAFDGFILGDGIGFWEADARDVYLLPTT